MWREGSEWNLLATFTSEFAADFFVQVREDIRGLLSELERRGRRATRPVALAQAAPVPAKQAVPEKRRCECGGWTVIYCVRCGRPRCDRHIIWSKVEGWPQERLPRCDVGGCRGEESHLNGA